MTNWHESRLKDVVLLWVKGATPKRAEEAYYSGDDGIPWIRVSDLNEPVITKAQQYLTAEGAKKAGHEVPKGAVLLSVSGTIGKTAVAGMDLRINQAVQSMVFDETQVLPKYACFYFQFIQEQLEKTANKVTIPNLTKAQLENTVIVYPDTDGQKRIIALLERVQDIVERQKRTWAEVKHILFQTLHDKWKKSWKDLPCACLKEMIAEPLLAGLSAAREEHTAVPYINTITPGIWGIQSVDEYPQTAVKPDAIAGYLLKKGDLLLRRYRTDECEPALLAERDLPGTVWGTGMFRVRVREEKLYPEFLLLWLYYSFRYLENEPYRGKTMTDARTMGMIWIPTVPMKEQEKIADIAHRIFSMQRRMKEMEQKAEAYYRAMLAYVFSAHLSEAYRRRKEPDRYFEIKSPDFLLNYESSKRSEWQEYLNDSERELLTHLSEFQRELLRICGEAQEPLPVHVIFKRVKKENRGYFRTQSIQDAIASVKILEGLGILARAVPEKLMLGEEEISDARDKPITIQKYELAKEEEKTDEIGLPGD